MTFISGNNSILPSLPNRSYLFLFHHDDRLAVWAQGKLHNCGVQPTPLTFERYKLSHAQNVYRCLVDNVSCNRLYSIALKNTWLIQELQWNLYLSLQWKRTDQSDSMIRIVQHALLADCLHRQKYIHRNHNWVFYSLYKVERNGIIGIKGFNNCKKKVASSRARHDIRDYYWFRSPISNFITSFCGNLPRYH